MVRKLCNASIFLFSITLPVLSFADQPCAAGDNNPLCASDMVLTTANKNLFCAGSSIARPDPTDDKPNVFRHAAVKGAKIMGKPCDSWGCIAKGLTPATVNYACMKVEQSWCDSHWGNKGGKFKNDCDNVLVNNCVNDYKFFLANCPKPN